MPNSLSNDPIGHTHSNRHGLLRSLIESLHHLSIILGTRMRQAHIRDRRQMEHAKGNYDVWGKLSTHVEQMPTQELPAESAAGMRHKKSGKTQARPLRKIEGGRRFKQLSSYFSRQALIGKHPHMDEKMCSSAMQHINLALHLAGQGNKEGAKVRIHLAESAMHTASRFMTHEDYERFEQKVEHRLQEIVNDQSTNH